MTDYLENKQITEEVVTYFKDMASKMVDDPYLKIPCYFCQESVEVWEALTVAHLFSGVPAHFSCPVDAFFGHIKELGLEDGYNYKLFSDLINDKLSDGTLISTDLVAGEIEIVDMAGDIN
ncbi:MAG: hypothetical protein JXR95_06940 [Deltaproteobacteria bacterium]|nr:hypothetical protein [Deltaproteobacteria bacterium]